MKKQTLRGPNGIKLEIDTNDSDTPAIVSKGATQADGGREYSATFNCAIATGELDGCELTQRELDWLDTPAMNELVDTAYDVARAGMKEYS